MLTNKVTVQGNSLIIEANTPIVGLINLLDFVDTTIGEDVNNSFYKTFRVSIDGGLSWTAWDLLLKEKLEAIQVEPEEIFLIQYKYEKSGDDTTELAFKNITLYAEKLSVSCPVEYQNSTFAQFFSCDDPNLLGWAVNVTAKMYRQGVIPKYLERGAQAGDEGSKDDDDYLAFWGTVATYFATVVNYGRTFLDFANQPLLLGKFIRQYDLRVCDYEDVTKMRDYMSRSMEILQKRGTLGILNDEFLQMICYKEGDELLFKTVDQNKTGWYLNKTSPLYKKVRDNNKMYTEDLYNVTEGTVTYTNGSLTFEDNSTIDNGNLPDTFITVSPDLSYVIAFDYATSDPTATIKLGLLAKLENGTQTTYFGGATFFLDAVVLNDGHYRININKSTPTGLEGFTFLDGVVSVAPFIQIVQPVGETVTVSNLNLAPLSTTYAPNSYLQPLKQIEVFCINNGVIPDEVVKELTDYKLVNYNNELKMTFI